MRFQQHNRRNPPSRQMLLELTTISGQMTSERKLKMEAVTSITASIGMLPSRVKDAVKSQTTWITLGGLTLMVFFLAVHSPSQLLGRDELYSTQHGEKRKAWTTRAAEWEIHNGVRDEEDTKNWAGRKKMVKLRSEASLWWDESAERYFISKIEQTQFPANCSETHVIAHPEWFAGLLSAVHVSLFPVFFAMLRGHTFVPVTYPEQQLATFDGCGPTDTERNLLCYFNLTSCNLTDDPRLPQILSEPMTHEENRTSYEELLMAPDEFFSPGGFTVLIQSFKYPTWDTTVFVASSSLSSFYEAVTHQKLTVWDAMGYHGKVGVVTSTANQTASSSSVNSNQESRQHRLNMVLLSLMSSWILNRMPNKVKDIADEIMSRYEDKLGQPIWKAPVLAVHIRRSDKTVEDPYYIEHQSYRPVEEFVEHMKQMEEQYGFEWPSIFVMSDSGTASHEFVTLLNGNFSDAPAPAPQLQQDGKRYIMQDWISNDHLIEKYRDHENVPSELKHDMQLHFLASLYIVERIADHAIVTYSSNVGRFIGEIMSAKRKMAFVGTEGPLVTSLDVEWFY